MKQLFIVAVVSYECTHRQQRQIQRESMLGGPIMVFLNEFEEEMDNNFTRESEYATSCFDVPIVPLVLVTGVSGYIGSWVAYAALKAGYRVRDICPDSRFKIELVECDLNSDSGWDDAVQGCDYILHVASPFPIMEPADENELIKPAVEGTLRVLSAASNANPRPKRVVITSSMAAACHGSDKVNYDENDWSILDDPAFPVSGYAKSKTLSERAAWDFVSKLPPEKKFELCSILPWLVLGPMLSYRQCPSVEFIKNIMMQEHLALPNTEFGLCSVFDVTRAHILAMTKPEAAGKRFAICSMSMNIRTIAAILTEKFSPYGYNPTSLHAPSTLIKIFAFLGVPSAKRGLSELGRKGMVYHTDNTQRILGLSLEPEFDLIIEMALAAIALGIIPDKSPMKQLTRTYAPPPCDLSMVPFLSSTVLL